LARADIYPPWKLFGRAPRISRTAYSRTSRGP
jgi:hypothetical protein